MTAAPTAPAKRRPLLTTRRLVYAITLAGAAVALVAAFTIHPEPKPIPRDAAIVTVSPKEGDTDLRQTTVSADLVASYSGSLRFDGTAIPDDQVDRINTGNNRVSFTPGPSKEFTRFAPGRHCATITFWPTGQPPESTSRSYAWCFNLH
jgi:hypothetical protein